MEKSEINGYTEEEFQSLLALMGLDSLFNSMRGCNVWEGWTAETPGERFLIIEIYRKAVADRERSVNGKQ